MVFEQNQRGVLIRVRLMPNSSCCRISGVFVDANNEKWLKVCVVSVPEKGKAKQELSKFLSKELKVAKSDIEIVTGELDRYKKLLVKINKDELLRWLKEKGI